MLIIHTYSITEQKNKNALIEECIADMTSGSTVSMGKLYSLIKGDVYAYALSKLADKQNAEDITHDTFVKIYKNASYYVPKGKPLAWIFTIELNLIKRLFQLSNRSVSYEQTFCPDRDIGEEDFSSAIINNDFLRSVLQTLSPIEREIIVLHVNSGLKHREIAKLLQMPLATVLSKYSRAIKKLQIIVKEG